MEEKAGEKGEMRGREVVEEGRRRVSVKQWLRRCTAMRRDFREGGAGLVR